jgi:ATP-dependent helicase/nuclease subunit A
MTVPLVDQGVRELIRTRIDENMSVEAGAGTGKTTILVARIVEIIRTGRATIDHTVVITFTEKAAAELATRVREALERALVGEIDEDERRRFDEALRELYRARIETIHAFASSLLRERPVEAALDPNFEVLDQLRADLSFEEQFRRWINQYLNSDSGERDGTRNLRRALNRSFQITQMREVTRAVHDRRYVLPLAREEIVDPDVFGFRGRLLADARELLELTASCTNLDDLGLPEIQRVLDLALRCERAGSDRQRLERVILAARATNAKSGAKGNWKPSEHCDLQKGIRKQINADLSELQQALRAGAIASVLPLAEEFVRDYERQRRDAGQAEFEDLLVWARNLLRDKPHVRAHFQDRFRRVLVDEFQDTDPLQVEIVLYLTSDDHDEKDWTKLRPGPGRLFVVGDPKQSIYRFRRADISIYEQVKEEILFGANQVIQQNFRSVPEVIEWANDVFSELIQPAERVQPDYIPLAAARKSIDYRHSPVVVVHSPMPAGKAEDIRREEARLLAGMIRYAVEEARWPVFDDASDGGTRDAKYGDIAILVPTRTGLDLYEEVLAEAGIPFRHEGGRQYFTRQEIRDLRACLRAIDDPGDRLSIVAALRSSAFGCSDQHLYQYARAGGRFDYRAAVNGEHSEIAYALQTLHELHRDRQRLTLPEIVQRTVERTNLIEFALTLPNGGDQSAANLLKMIDQARAFSAANGGGLRAFVRWTVTSSENRSDESDAMVAEATDDVVRLLTIHAAKGLEFPIVALANLHQGGGGGSGPTVYPSYQRDRIDIKIGSKEYGFKTPGFDDAEALEKEHEEAETLRKLYVAATRAADYLILPLAVDQTKAKGMLGHLAPRLPALSEETAGVDVGAQHVFDPALLPPVLPVDGGRDEPFTDADVERERERRRSWRAEQDASLNRANRPLRVVTASSQKGWERPAGGGDFQEDGAIAGADRSQAVRIGNALHRVMERVDLRAEPNLDALIEATIADEDVGPLDDDARDRVSRMVRTSLKSDVVRRALRIPRVLREAEFGYGLPDGGLVQGQIDLLFQEDSGLVIVDFKSDRVRAEQVDERTRESYRGQAAVYAFAAHQITGLPVREVTFFYAEPGVASTLHDTDALIAEGRRLAEGESAELGVDDT